jgi:signal transduction histidine kinase
MSDSLGHTENRLAQLKDEYDIQRIMLEDALNNVEKKNSALQKVNYELEEKKFELEQFIYRLNHDFKSPVASIKGLIELLKMDQNATNEVIERLKDPVSRLASLISNMSYFYNTTQMNVEKLGLFIIFNSIISKFQSDIIKNKIEIKSNFEPKTQNMGVINQDFEAIFGCVISNAITFLDHKKQLHELMVNVAIQNNNLLIEFKDNGIGVEKNFQEEIFKIFVKGNNQSKGAGLGLYILYKIVKKYKGNIHVESDINEGMELKISIPLQSLY